MRLSFSHDKCRASESVRILLKPNVHVVTLSEVTLQSSCWYFDSSCNRIGFTLAMDSPHVRDVLLVPVTDMATAVQKGYDAKFTMQHHVYRQLS